MDLSIDGLRALIAQSGQQELIVTIICIVGIAAALANCFAGYRLLPVWIMLLGAALGAILGYRVCSFFQVSAVVQASAILAAACLCALLTCHFRAVGSFLLCAAMAFSFSYYFLFYVLGYANITAYTLIAAVIGVLCGFLSHLLKKPVIILITALCGAYTAWSTASSLLHIYYSQQLYWAVIGVLALAGIIIQFLTPKHG